MWNEFRGLVRGAALAAGMTVILVGFGMNAAQAQPRSPHEGPRRGFDHLDGRFNHNHYYPGRGYAVGALPRDHIVVNGPHGRYFYSGGVWYAPRGPRFVVVGPPIGLFVPVLPPIYTTVWFGGVPYYYANDTYYLWREDDRQYEVVSPPDEQSGSTEAPANEETFIYPKNGQSDEQQAQDKYECHRWAQSETGFDPTKPAGGVEPDQAGAKREGYQNAMAACLEGRGYSIK